MTREKQKHCILGGLGPLGATLGEREDPRRRPNKKVILDHLPGPTLPRSQPLLGRPVQQNEKSKNPFGGGKPEPKTSFEFGKGQWEEGYHLLLPNLELVWSSGEVREEEGGYDSSKVQASLGFGEGQWEEELLPQSPTLPPPSRRRRQHEKKLTNIFRRRTWTGAAARWRRKRAQRSTNAPSALSAKFKTFETH